MLSRLAANEEVLVATCDRLTAAVAEGHRITPAGEWLLDNFYLIEEQVQMARRHLPRISHVSAHMGFGSLDPSLAALVKRLAQEYRLEAESGPERLKRFAGWGKATTPEERVAQFIKNLEALEAGPHLFVEHPGLDVPEMQAIEFMIISLSMPLVCAAASVVVFVLLVALGAAGVHGPHASALLDPGIQRAGT